MLVYLSQGLLLGGTAAAQPGPFQAFLLSETVKNGWRSTFWATFAPLISDGPIILLVLLVLTQTPPWLLNVLQIAGGLFLFYLALGAFRTYRQSAAADPLPEEPAQRGLLKAALLNALSPNPYIFWATIAGPIFIEAWRLAPPFGLSFVLGFYVTLIGGFMGFVALFAMTKQLDPRVSRALGAVSAVALFLFGCYQLWQGGTALLAGGA